MQYLGGPALTNGAGADAFAAGAVSSVAGLTGAITASALSSAMGVSSDFAQLALSLAELRGNQQGMAAGVADGFEDADGISAVAGFTYDVMEALYRQNVSPVGTPWTARTLPTTANLLDVCYSPSLDLYVAVGNASGAPRILTSPDGVTWTQRTAPAGDYLQGCCWSPELSMFLVVNFDVTFLTSPDGVTWTQRTAPAGSWRKATWSGRLNLFVAAGETSALATSPDGVTWTLRTSAQSTAYRSIVDIESLGLLVACGLVAFSSGPRLATSPDGITWTARTPASSTATVAGLAWLPDAALIIASMSDGRVQTSPDGITWTDRATGNATGWASVFYDQGGLVVAVGTGGKVYTSPDGITWTARTTGLTNDLERGVASGPGGEMVVVGYMASAVHGVLTAPTGGVLAGSLTSVSYPATAAPVSGMLTILATALSGVVTPNTSLIGKISRDGGTSWTTVALIAGTTVNRITTYEAKGVNLAAQPTGTAMRYKLEAATAARHAVTGVALQWSPD